jgi:hypothetical protein
MSTKKFVHKKILSFKFVKNLFYTAQNKTYKEKKTFSDSGDTFEKCKNPCTLGREAYLGGAYIGPKRILSGATLQYYHL